MKKISVLLSALALSISVSSSAHADEKAKVEALVRRTAADLKKDPTSVLKEVSNKASTKFKDGEYYVFIYDPSGTVKAIGFNADVMVGKNLWEKKDPDGLLFVQGFVNLAKDKKEGWFDYKFPNPTNGKVQQKTSFVMRVDLTADQAKANGISGGDWLVVGSGLYK